MKTKIAILVACASALIILAAPTGTFAQSGFQTTTGETAQGRSKATVKSSKSNTSDRMGGGGGAKAGGAANRMGGGGGGKGATRTGGGALYGLGVPATRK